MKIKNITMASLFLLGGCSLLNTSGSSINQLTTAGKLEACSIEEATSMVQSGKAFTLGIAASAEEISSNCIQKLALQSAGLDGQATKDATDALTTLMNAAK